MRIITSYFAKIDELIKNGYQCVSIAAYNPRWIKAEKYTKCPELAPDKEDLKLFQTCQITEEEFAERYMAKLKTLGFLEAFHAISRAAKDSSKVALLCYEKQGDFCHRHIFADWYFDNVRVDTAKIREFGEKNIGEQGDLFRGRQEELFPLF